MAHTLAASASENDVWIATSAGLYRGRDGACARVALPGRDVIAVAAVGGAVAAATDDLLWRSTDGGGTFRVVAGMVARPRALAIVDEQRTLVATDDAVIEIGPHGAMRAVLDRGGAALAVCDGARARLRERRRLDLARGTRPPNASAIGRPRGRSPAATEAARVSSRRATACSRPPTGRPGGNARAVAGRTAAAAAIGNRIWLAADDGLVALDEIATIDLRRNRRERLPCRPCRRCRRAGSSSRCFRGRSSTLVFTAQHTPLRDGLVAGRAGRVPTGTRGRGARGWRADWRLSSCSGTPSWRRRR